MLCVTVKLFKKKNLLFLAVAVLKKAQALFFHESSCKMKMNTGGELIWTVSRQMPIIESVGNGKAGSGTSFTDNIFNVLSFVVTGQLSH